MPLISVITAAYAPTADYLAETAASISALELPPGFDLEWVVQEDGDSPQLAGFFAGLDFARYEANGRRYGTALTRNLALGPRVGRAPAGPRSGRCAPAWRDDHTGPPVRRAPDPLGHRPGR